MNEQAERLVGHVDGFPLAMQTGDPVQGSLYINEQTERLPCIVDAEALSRALIEVFLGSGVLRIGSGAF